MSSSKKVALYEASVKVMGKTFKAKGKTIAEAIEKLKPGNVAGMCVLVVSRGKNSKEHIIPHARAKRLFNAAGVSREVQVKNASLMFDGV